MQINSAHGSRPSVT